MSLAEVSGQSGCLSDLGYFLDKPGVLNRDPVLVLLTRPDAGDRQEVVARDLLAAFLLFEYRAFGLRTGVYTSNDRSGRSTLVAPLSIRDEALAVITRWLHAEGAHLLLFSYRGQGFHENLGKRASHLKADLIQVTRERLVPDYLELAPTFEGTLASIGQKTRSNMRYYRRRAERELGCVFLPEAKISYEELQAFNQSCMYAVPDWLARWRVDALSSLKDPILAGLKDRDGRWISLLGGRRQGTCTEVLWQMNRKDLPNQSISLVLRSYLIEHEVKRGATRFTVEGGTPHPLSHSFRQERIRDVLTLRRTLRARLVSHLARRMPGVSNELVTMLDDPTLPQFSGKFLAGLKRWFPARTEMKHFSGVDELS